MSADRALFPASTIGWLVSTKGDADGRALAERHYTRQTPGAASWTRPGYNYVLVLPDGRGVFVWWRPKWEAGIERMDGLRAIECTIFRNSSPRRSSDLVREAVEALSWPAAGRYLHGITDPPDGLITGVSSAKTARRRSRRSLPGKCFREAGWVEFDHAKGVADVWLRYVGGAA